MEGAWRLFGHCLHWYSDLPPPASRVLVPCQVEVHVPKGLGRPKKLQAGLRHVLNLRPAVPETG